MYKKIDQSKSSNQLILNFAVTIICVFLKDRSRIYTEISILVDKLD